VSASEMSHIAQAVVGPTGKWQRIHGEFDTVDTFDPRVPGARVPSTKIAGAQPLYGCHAASAVISRENVDNGLGARSIAVVDRNSSARASLDSAPVLDRSDDPVGGGLLNVDPL
jgi:hypothetical protein